MYALLNCISNRRQYTSQFIARMVSSTLEPSQYIPLSTPSFPQKQKKGEQNSHSKSPSANRHRPQQRRPHPLPKPPPPFPPPRLPHTINHPLVPHPRPKPITLHLALDHIKRITPQPQRLPRQPAIPRHLPRLDLLPPHPPPLPFPIHQILKTQEPEPVRLRLA